MTFFRKYIFSLLFIAVLLTGLFCVSADVAFAQNDVDADTFGVSALADQETGLVLGRSRIQVVVANIINVALGLLGIIALGIVVYGGWLYMTSRGNEEQMARARKVITNGVIGLAVILASFTIVRFILGAISSSTNSGVLPGDGEAGDVADPRCLDPDFFDRNRQFCLPNELSCEDQFFVVTSLTPTTLDGQTTNMNNITVRAVFSWAIADDTNLDTALVLVSGQNRIPLDTQVVGERRKVLEATFNTQDFCHENQTCLALGDYTITVNDAIESQATEERDSRILDVETNNDCGSYPNTTDFSVTTDLQIDTTDPVIEAITVDGNGGDHHVLHRNARYVLRADVTDSVLVNDQLLPAGVSYVRARIFEKDADPDSGHIIYDGPRVSEGSSDPYSFSYRYVIPRDAEPLTEHTIEITAYDIDHNSVSAQVDVTVVGERGHCDQDGAPLRDEFRDECLDPNGRCESDRDCPNSYRCIENQCVGLPTVLDVDPWNGAEGNWVTILGRHFGTDEGEVSFGIDMNNDNVIDDEDAWIPAQLAQCGVANSWTNDWIIAEVPGSVGYALDVNELQENVRHGVDHGRAAYAQALNPTDAITLEAWVYPRQFENLQGNILRLTGAYGLFVGADGQKPWGRVHLADNRVASINQNIATESIAQDAWSHLVLTADGNSLRVYVNGVLSGEVAYQGQLATVPNPIPIVVGTQNGSQGFWNGGLDELRIYNRAISDDEVREHEQGIFNNNTGLVAHWGFEEARDGHQEQTADLSGSGHTLTVFGTTVTMSKRVGPIGSLFVAGDEASIRIRRADDQEDTTTNNRGVHRLFTKNDVLRPGLCQVVKGNNPDVDFDTNITQAGPGEPVMARGQGFGQTRQDGSELLFGGIRGVVTGWSDALLNATVPENIVSGRLGVRVVVDGEESNGVPFTIINGEEQGEGPLIVSISPERPTPGSYVTITGERFGQREGTVYMAGSATQAQTCAREHNDQGCTILALPQGCQQGSWRPTEVIVEIPGDVAVNTEYHIALRTDTGGATDGSDILSVDEGEPLPSLCRVVPNSGPAPRQTPISLYGTNLVGDDDPSVYYWWLNANAEDVQGTWLSSLVDENPLGGDVIDSIVTDEDTNITTIVSALPVKPDGEFEGYSMSTGPIRVDVDGQLSNPVQYEVLDCTQEGTLPPDGRDREESGYHCCTSGRDQGLWKQNNLLCEGETRDAGYVWRFTTGKIPQALRVIEQCDPNGELLPSPSPWRNWRHGQNVCVNAQVAVRFSAPLKASSLPPAKDTVRIYRCEDNGAQPRCTLRDDTDLTDEFEILIERSGNQGVIKLSAPPNEDGNRFLDQNTWYRVTLSNEIVSEEFVTILGESVERNAPLQPSRALPNSDVAYFFDFQTSAGRCELTDAHMQPPTFEANYLGVLQDPGAPFDESIDDPANPLYFYVWGETTQECRVIDADGAGWDWTSDDEALVEVTPAVSDQYVDSRATVRAIDNTFPEYVTIRAATSTQLRDIEAASDVTIRLGDPQVSYYEPNCFESCVNASVVAQFTRPIIAETLQTGVSVYSCALASCQNPVLISQAAYDIIAVSAREFRIAFQNHLEPDAYYKVWINREGTAEQDKVRGLGRIAPPLPGNAVPEFFWRFKTKDDATACGVNRVSILPHPWTARDVGEKRVYEVIPYSTPNECSSRGQVLDAWDFGWDWSVDDTTVASTTKFDTGKGALPGFCTDSCVPRGSDVDRNADVPPLCGNGVLDVGEDCDIAIGGEQVGVTCTLSCVRPGALSEDLHGVDIDRVHCGNGVVDNPDVRPELSEDRRGNGRVGGEQCDPGNVDGIITTDDPYCNELCQFRGSGAFETENNNAVCGDGRVDLGEACDGTLGCSSSCLHEGTPVSAAWCQDGDNFIFEDATECIGAVSVCGNGSLEQGEECEIGAQVQPGLTLIYFPNGEQAISTTGGSECSSRCLLENACENPTFPSSVRCEAGTPGCNDDCTYAGSSLLYNEPSLCGDAQVGIGEVAFCEIDPQQHEQGNVAGENPLQIVTAIGGSEDVDELLRQHTQVNVSLRTNNALTDSGDYYLQCGFTEFEEPLLVNDDPVSYSFNNCPNNSYGVGSNSCCYPRPTRIDEYPVDTTALPGVQDPELQEAVCRNSLISVTYSGEIDESSLRGNLLIASGHIRDNFICADIGQDDVTPEVQGTLLAYGADTGEQTKGWFGRIISRFTGFVRQLFGLPANASLFTLEDNRVWCSGAVSATPEVTYERDEDDTIIFSTVTLRLNNLLDEDTIYAVVSKGGPNGVVDARGVSIISSDNDQSLSDSFAFQTGSEVCRINRVEIDPSSQLFTGADQIHDFGLTAFTSNNQQIVPVPGQYNWAWGWGPAVSNLFTVPADGGDTDQPFIDISSTVLQGQLDAVGFVRVTEDIGRREGDEVLFSATSRLTSLFCERPWPGVDVSVYADDVYNFSMSYCADNGRSGDTLDDLPFFQELEARNIGRCNEAPFGECRVDDDCPGAQNSCTVFRQIEIPVGICQNDQRTCESDADCSGEGDRCIVNDTVNLRSPEVLPDGVIDRRLFFNDKNDDVLGIQIFANPERLSVRSWYRDQEVNNRSFANIADFQDTRVERFPAITDGNNYYVDALNIVDGVVYSNIYHFTINSGAQERTKNVFSQLISSMAFNTNLSDHGYCGVADEDQTEPDFEFVNTACTNDFDCIGVVVEQEIAEVEGTCSNDPDTSCQDDLACSDDGVCEGFVPARVAVHTAPDCKAERTEFLTDWERLHDIRDIQQTLLADFANDDSFPVLSGGTFLPHYTNSRWPSWNQTLAAELSTTFPIDEVNEWTGCGLCEGQVGEFCTDDSDCDEGVSCNLHDQQTCWNAETAQFACPAEANVYEYEFDRDSDTYILHAPLDFFSEDDSAVSEFIIDPSRFTTDRFCQPEEAYSPFGERCGDGLVNPQIGEECDPPGFARVSDVGLVGGQEGSCDYSLATVSCLADADCPVTYFDIEDEVVIPFGPEDSVCAWDGSLLYGDIVDNEARAFSCVVDADCRRASTYASSQVPITSISEQLADFDPQQGNFDDNFGCVRVEDVTEFDNEVESVSCVGAVPEQLVACGLGEVAIARCSNTCTIEYGQCEPQFICGNGLVEGDELCDDGPRNGQYGQCATNCLTRVSDGGFCGNGIIDVNSNDQPIEFCDVNDPQTVGRGYCTENPDRVCSGDDADASCTYQTSGVCQLVHELEEDVCSFGYDSGDWDRSCTVGQPCWHQYQFNNLPVDLAQQFGRDIIDINSDSTSVCAYGVDVIYDVDAQEDGRGIFAFGCQNDGQCRSVAHYQQRASNGASTVLANMPLLEGAPLGTWQDQIRNLGFLFGDQLAPFGCVEVEGGSFAQWYTPEPDETILCEDVNIGNYRCSNREDVICNINNGDNDCADLDIADVCVADDISSYHVDAQYSCAVDCQGPGGFCGDGIVQPPFESCDDGNTQAGDGCSVYCQDEQFEQDEAPIVNEEFTFCGDGIVQEDGNTDGVREICDLGDENGFACDPFYGESCRYCSADCREILTVDPIAFCGNHDIDQITVNSAEACEITEDGDIVRRPLSGLCSNGLGACFSDAQCINQLNILDSGVCEFELEVLTCEDKGTYSCTQACTNLAEGCVTCAPINAPLGARPQLAVINPVVGNFDEEDAWARASSLRLTRRDNEFGFGTTADERIDLPSDYNDRFALRDENRVDNEHIEANAICQGEYQVHFTTTQDQHANEDDGGALNFDAQVDPNDLFVRPISLAQINQKFFDYAVSSEPFTVYNELVASPPVPEGTYRFVLRWGPEEENQRRMGVALKLYNLGLDGLKIDGHPLLETSDFIEFGEVYDDFWWPDTNTFGAFRHNGDQYLYAHPEGNLEQTYVQSLTLDTNRGPQENTYALFVAGTNGPMGLYTDTNLELDVYAYLPGADGRRGIYKPVRTFAIRQARGTNSNPTARYWHVLNIGQDENGVFEIQDVAERFLLDENDNPVTRPNGSIETGFRDIKCNLPADEEVCQRIGDQGEPI